LTPAPDDDVIFEEFRAPETWRCTSNRKLVERRVFPSIDIHKSEPARRSC